MPHSATQHAPESENLSLYTTLTKRNLHFFHDPLTIAELFYGTFSMNFSMNFSKATVALREENHEELYYFHLF